MKPFQRTGVLAIDPRALFELYVEGPAAGNTEVSGVAVVNIRGPLVAESGLGWDSYDAIGSRVAAACQGPAHTIVLKIDSPGGDVSGAFDAARGVRRLAAAANKKLVAYVSGSACSAAYAIAAAASAIVMAEAAVVGSIGILDQRTDVTAQDAAFGVRYAIVTSGARKADGHPHTAITDAELVERQALVNSMAATFFGLVAELRGVGTEVLAGMQARLFHGAAAVAAGLADRVEAFDAFIATVAKGAAPMAEEEKKKEPADMAAIRAALTTMAEGDDDDAKKAKAALAAMADGPGDGEEEEEEEEEEGSGTEAKAEAAAPAAQAQAAVPDAITAAIAQAVQPLMAKFTALENKGETDARAQFLATRPDLSKEQLAVLQGKPLAEVKAIVSAFPQAGPLAGRVSAERVQGTRGKGQTSEDQARPVPQGEYADAMLTAFGRAPTKDPVRMEGLTQVFEVMSPEAARKRVKELAEKGARP